MDIIDIILAKALTPQGQIESYARLAEEAITNANLAVSNIEDITDQTNANNLAAEETLENAQAAITAANQVLEELNEGVESYVSEEINKISLTLNSSSTNDSITKNLTLTYPNNSVNTINNIIKYYTSIGNNTDGTMTQKAISNAISETVSEAVSEAITNLNINLNFNSENEGKFIIVDNQGFLTVSNLTEETLLNSLNNSTNVLTNDIIGIKINYKEKAVYRLGEAITLSAGADFDKYSFYGGRKRCNVNDNGLITAFYGEANYTEDGSNGQVMVYQPKFYYRREPVKVYFSNGKMKIEEENFYISDTLKNGFKIHPLFVDENNEILDFVLFSAYEGSCFDTSANSFIQNDEGSIDFNEDKLSSIADIKPISGQSNELTILNAEQLAKNRGSGWHITNLQAISANQILMMIEYASLNGQYALGKGVSHITNSTTTNIASNTGSTSVFGNSSGRANFTVNITNGVYNNFSDEDKCSISYRGLENPWGNLWKFIGGLKVFKANSNSEIKIYFCDDFNYSENISNSNYHDLNIILPLNNSWVSELSYNENYDWILLPTSSNYTGNSLLPIGDLFWSNSETNIEKCVVYGGPAFHEDNNGLFYYAMDQNFSSRARSYGARLILIPSKNQSTYETNIEKWHNLA